MKKFTRFVCFFLIVFAVFTALDYFSEGELKLIENAATTALATLVYFIAFRFGAKKN